MRVIWADEAIESVDNIADYIEENFGVERSIQSSMTRCSQRQMNWRRSPNWGL